jgi:hypothetical protein
MQPPRGVNQSLGVNPDVRGACSHMSGIAKPSPVSIAGAVDLLAGMSAACAPERF